MKVVLLNDQLNAGGAERVLVNMANQLHKNGVEVKVVLFLKPSILDALIDPDIPVSYLHRKGRFDLRAMFALKKEVRTFDIVHVHSRYNLRYYFVSKILTGIKKPKIVFHEHIPILKVDYFTRFCLKKSNAYLAVLKSMCLWAEKTLHLPSSHIFYLPNIVCAPIGNINQQLSGCKIMMTGNIWHFKNQLFAVDLINELPESYTLDIYGRINDKNYYQKMIAKIEKDKLQHRIKIIQSVNNIYEVTGKYNFAIHTSPDETGPLVLIEYMYAGLPFLAYKTGDVIENVIDELPEVVMNSFDIENWKNSISHVMNNDKCRSHIRQKMKAIVAQKFSEDKYFQQLNHIYQSILN